MLYPANVVLPGHVFGPPTDRALGRRGIVERNVEERLFQGKGHAMERHEPKGRTLPSVRRGFARSRLEQQFLACAYERVVPQVCRDIAVGRQGRIKQLTPTHQAAAGA